jgi:hypothetical protein
VEITVPIIKTPRPKAYTASNGKVARSNGSGGVSNVRGGSEKIYCSVLINEKKMCGMHFLILGLYVGIKQCNKQVIQFNKIQSNLRRRRKRLFIVGVIRFN